MKLLIAGDYCETFRVKECVANGDYSRIFGKIKDTISKMDYSIVNFEFPIVCDEKRTQKVYKCGPTLRGSLSSVDALKYVGFNCCTLANNHILDQGADCCLDTKKILQEAGIDTVGAGDTLTSAGNVLYKHIGDITLAIINCCEHEFSIAHSDSPGANPLNAVHQYYKIKEARENADFVVVIVHGGHEHYQLPSIRMKETYHFFIDAGADAVINHHQHCYSGYEVYNKKPIFYGLGNFCFDWEGRIDGIWNEGFFLVLNLRKEKEIDYEIIPFKQCGKNVGIYPLEDDTSFHSTIEKLNNIIKSDSKLSAHNKAYYLTEESSILNKYEPYNNRVLRRLYGMGILPSVTTKKQLLAIWNYIECESHRDKQIAVFNEWRDKLK